VKRSELKTYPPPPCTAGDMGIPANPSCICSNAMQAFFCPTGHMLECHYPMDCQEAKCSHLAKYEVEFEEES